ncbi:MAG: hypothetical protein J7500_08445 [Sphingomonas sp.]|uniref:hypothetical protein n=1 Tax=Sphingomonas sp. TaxID=28214 RepID=UPI001B21EFAE|nr:hypothetical protein [Sphingomonas sp.]MBO9622728.1 hypothetical protein [Sphingomonas sp.]
MVQSTYPAAAALRRASLPRFEVHADRCPQALAKIVGMLANLDLLPRELQARQSCGGIWIAFEVEIEPARAERLAERFRALTSVAAVVLMLYPVDTAPQASEAADGGMQVRPREIATVA